MKWEDEGVSMEVVVREDDSPAVSDVVCRRKIEERRRRDRWAVLVGGSTTF